jgi:hypothetical protein
MTHHTLDFDLSMGDSRRNDTGVHMMERSAPPADEVPWADHVTQYDQEHFMTYLRLLDAAADGASEEEMARIVLGIDPRKEPERAEKALASHLKRAQWMTTHGYRDLLES